MNFIKLLLRVEKRTYELIHSEVIRTSINTRFVNKFIEIFSIADTIVMFYFKIKFIFVKLTYI